MKKLIISSLLFSFFFTVNAQTQKTDVLQDLGKSPSSVQELRLTALAKTSTRLFREKNDLTTVIMIIPKGSIVEVTGSDSTYFHVLFEENDGYILRRHAVLEDPIDISRPAVQTAEPVQAEKPAVKKEQQPSRFSYLEEKYGSSMAAKLIEGKIWKGMNSEMIKDSWGKANKVNRVISGNTIKEEWIYKNTWLYLENDILIEWGPIRD